MTPGDAQGAPEQGFSGGGAKNRGAALFVAAVGSFLMPFMGSSVNVALPSIGHEFGLGALALSWISTSYLLATAMLLLPMGRLADLYGRSRLYLLGIASYAAASLVCALAPGATALLVGRVLQGAGASMMTGTSMALVASAFPPGERGRALGMTVASVYLGLSLGPFFGGLLTQHLGWRSLFWANAGLGTGVFVLAWTMLLPERRVGPREPFDLLGSLLWAASLCTGMIGISRLPSSTGLALAAGGLGGLSLFGLRELRAPSPVLDLNLLRRNRVFLFSSLAALVNYSATFAVSFLLSLYLQTIQGMQAQHAGLVLVGQPVIQTLFSPLAGRLSDRVEPRLVASLGMALTVIGLLLLTLLQEDSHLLQVEAGLVVLGLGFALFSSPNTNAVMSSVDRRIFGVASGMLGTMRLLGQMLSMGIATLVIALLLGTAEVTPELFPVFLHAMKITFVLLALLCFAGIFASLARGKLHG